MVPRIFALLGLLHGSGFIADAKTEPWCTPASVVLKFSDDKGREALTMELASTVQACSLQENDQTISVYREPRIRLTYYGKLTDVPNRCLIGFTFKMSDVAVAIGERGVGIKILGSSVNGKRVRTVIYTIDNDVLCNQSEE